MKQIYLIALMVLVIAGGNVHAEDGESINDVMKADQNSDGKVSFEEYKAAHEERMKARFNRKDINQDGFIDVEEKQAAKEKLQAQQKAAKDAETNQLREKYQEERKKRKKHFFKYQ